MEKKSEQLTLFAEDSPANHIVKPGSKEARMMTATSGRKCLGSFKSASPVGLLERMLLGSPIWSSTARYLIWRKKITKSGFSYSVLSPSKPPIKDKGAGLLPTPDASNRGARKNQNGHQVTLQDVVAGHTPEAKKIKEMFLTPNVMDSLPPRSKEALQKQYEKNRKGRTTHSTLREQVVYPEPDKMWPTPNTRDTRRGCNQKQLATEVDKFPSKMWPTPTQDSAKQRTDNYKQGGTPLPKAVKMWPTATTRDYKGGYQTGALIRKDGKNRAMDLLPNAVLDGKGTETVKGQLNAEWVTWLMGYPPNYLTLEEPGK